MMTRYLFEGLPQWLTRSGFEGACQARRRSVEHDFGVGWRLGLGSTWRLSWIRATGEVYAEELAPRRTIVVLGVFLEGAQVASALGDWAEKCGQPGSLEWAVNLIRGSSCRVG